MIGVDVRPLVRAPQATAAAPRIGLVGLSSLEYIRELRTLRQIWFFTICGKNEAADLTADEKQLLKRAIQAELGARRKSR
jgi:hypothetical protein